MIDWYATYIPNGYAEQNPYRVAAPRQEPLPTFADAKQLLPEPFWAGHESALSCYWKVWELAFRNLKLPNPANGFVSPYIDTAFNGNLFLWDSAFILMFCRYASRAFNFQQTLDNFYCKQHPDGFICREIRQSDGSDCFKRFDPPATGPEVLPWAEWEYYQNFGDRERLAHVFPALLAYHQWMRHYRTWQDGTYWATGWACGMDNQPRLSIHRGVNAADGPVEWWDHDHMTWIDATFQAMFSAQILARMADVLDLEESVALNQEWKMLAETANRTLWNEEIGFYVDRFADGTLSTVKTIGAFWSLLAGGIPQDRFERMMNYMNDPHTFNRPHRVPTLSADHPDYNPAGGYWRGSVWAPTNYMVLRGLTANGMHDLAHEIGLNHHEQVVRVFEQTGTLWENYAPEKPDRGSTSAPEFVGWTGLPPTAVLFEYVFGLRPDVPMNRITWDVRLLEEFGVRQYPFGQNGLLDLHCASRPSPQRRPDIHVRPNIPLTVELIWTGGRETIAIDACRD